MYGNKTQNPNNQNNLEKEKWSWEDQPSGLQNLLQSYIHQTVWYWHKDRNIDQWNKITKARNKLMHLWAPYLDKAVKNMKWWKDSLFINIAGKIGQLHVKE